MAVKRAAGGSMDRPRKRQRSNYGATLTILVGPEETSFTVHQDRLCSTSEYFKKACTGEWLESKERVLRLADVDATIFQIYVEGLYFPSSELKEMLTDTSSDGVKEPLSLRACRQSNVETTFQVCGLWALADYLQDYAIQNKAIDLLENGVSRTSFGSVRIVTWLSAHTTSTSRLAKYLRSSFVEVLVDTKNTDAVLTALKDGEHKLPADVLIDLLKEVLSPTNDVPFCATYHVHPEGTETCAQAGDK
ncbi:hypothetical protein LTR10_011293 [Elasticomyces elasticus]|nr:hypothetical protein LTR10_011293 [Elasticomyces elasticus]KAK4966292.1 hypothetical protein LTR42_011453 [Elasticomyces elasticus]